MPRRTDVFTISLPQNMARAVNTLSHQTDQTRSELVRYALRDYLRDAHDDHVRFLQAYKQTRKEKKMSLKTLRKKYGLD